MVIKTQLPIYNVDNTTQLKDGEGKEMTLGSCLIAACLASNSQDVPEVEKYRRWKLAERVQLSRPCELSIEDIAYLKELSGKLFSPLVMGRVWDLLDPSPPTTMEKVTS